MKLKTMMACAALAFGLAACADDGYYDNDGHYHYYPDAADKASIHKPAGASPSAYKYNFNRRGYYDEYGNYITPESQGYFELAPNQYPARGMCRVWFTDRAPEYQPPAQPCARIRSIGVPAGAYVVYGG